MQKASSALSLSAAGLYMIVALACVVAASLSQSGRSPKDLARGWWMIALLFIALAASRYLGIEENLREASRSMLKSDMAYGERRDLQRPLVAAVVVVGSAVGFWLTYRLAQSKALGRNTPMLLAQGAALAMCGLIALRVISLHQVDSLLYGSLKINWLVDIGASLTVLGAAVYHSLRSRRAR